MKLIIAGGRTQRISDRDRCLLDVIDEEHKVTEVVSGGARGVDRDGEQWATKRGIPVKRFPVSFEDWRKLGLKAGPLRNARMAAYADALAVFPGNNGTSSMVREAKKRGLKVFDFR